MSSTLGLLALNAGARALVRGASKLALSFGTSPLVAGLTIAAFGTSAPEVAVSVGAVLDGCMDMAVGNVVGSNTFNILGWLGAAGLVAGGGLAGRQHQALPAFSAAMLSFVAPLTIVTLLVSVLRRQRRGH